VLPVTRGTALHDAIAAMHDATTRFYDPDLTPQAVRSLVTVGSVPDLASGLVETRRNHHGIVRAESSTSCQQMGSDYLYGQWSVGVRSFQLKAAEVAATTRNAGAFPWPLLPGDFEPSARRYLTEMHAAALALFTELGFGRDGKRDSGRLQGRPNHSVAFVRAVGPPEASFATRLTAADVEELTGSSRARDGDTDGGEDAEKGDDPPPTQGSSSGVALVRKCIADRAAAYTHDARSAASFDGNVAAHTDSGVLTLIPMLVHEYRCPCGRSSCDQLATNLSGLEVLALTTSGGSCTPSSSSEGNREWVAVYPPAGAASGDVCVFAMLGEEGIASLEAFGTAAEAEAAVHRVQAGPSPIASALAALGAEPTAPPSGPQHAARSRITLPFQLRFVDPAHREGQSGVSRQRGGVTGRRLVW
jgi:hypothetical protein